MIKNALFFKLNTQLTADILNEKLEKMVFREIGKVETFSAGFVPYADDLELIHKVGDIRVGVLRMDAKKIPGSTMKQLVKDKCQEVEQQQGYMPGRKQVREIKERLTDELLPKVLPTSKKLTFIVYDDFLVIDTSSGATADQLLGLLAKCIDPFPVESLHTVMSPMAAMTDWLIADEMPTSLTCDQEAEMRASGESRASVRWKGQSIDTKEVLEHHSQGKQVIKLAMTWADRISFTLNDKGVIGRITALDVLKEQGTEDNDADLLDSEIMLMGSEIHKLIQAVIDALGGEKII